GWFELECVPVWNGRATPIEESEPALREFSRFIGRLATACQDTGNQDEALDFLVIDFRVANRRLEPVVANPDPRKWRDQNAQNDGIDFALCTTRFAARCRNLAIRCLRIVSVLARTVLSVFVAFSGG